MPDKTRRERIFDALQARRPVLYGYSPVDILKRTLYPNLYFSQVAKSQTITSSDIIKMYTWIKDG